SNFPNYSQLAILIKVPVVGSVTGCNVVEVGFPFRVQTNFEYRVVDRHCKGPVVVNCHQLEFRRIGTLTTHDIWVSLGALGLSRSSDLSCACTCTSPASMRRFTCWRCCNWASNRG